MFKAFLSKLALTAVVLSLGSVAARATAFSLDLTNTAASANVNGALWQYSNAASGSGGYTSLFRVQNSGTESGYNYAGTPKPFDQVNGVGIYHVNLGDLTTVNIAGIDYVSIHFDANNANNLVFTDFRIFQHSDPSNLDPQLLASTEGALPTLGNLVYDMLGTNTGGANTITLTAFKSGSGTDDMMINIPLSNFTSAGYSLNDDIYFWTKMTGATGGFEEFAYLQTGNTVTAALTPEAHTIWGGGVMVASLLVGGMIRRRKAATVQATA